MATTDTESAITLREVEAPTEARAWTQDASRSEAADRSEAAEAASGESTGSVLTIRTQTLVFSFLLSVRRLYTDFFAYYLDTFFRHQF